MQKIKKNEQFHNNLALAKSDRIIPPVGVPANLAIRIVRVKKFLTQIDTSCFEIGKELAEIQAEKEYPEKTFALFIKNNFGHERNWGYQMIEGYRVKAGLPENVSLGIQNSYENKGLSKELPLKHALALSKVTPEKQAEVLKEASKNGKVTEKKISEAAKIIEGDFRVIVKDANGDEVPEEIAGEFQRSRDETKHIRSLLQEVRRWLEYEQTFKVELARTAAIESVKDTLSMVAVVSGDYLCENCKGAKCKVCHKRGFVSKLFYTQNKK